MVTPVAIPPSQARLNPLIYAPILRAPLIRSGLEYIRGTMPCHLPDEILAIVFTELASLESVASPSSATSDHHSSLMACAFANKHWHRLCLPLLWQRPSLMNESAAQSLLQLRLNHPEWTVSVRDLTLTRRLGIPMACSLIESFGAQLQTLTFTWYMNPEDIEPLACAFRALPKLRTLRFHRCYFMFNPMRMLDSLLTALTTRSRGPPPSHTSLPSPATSLTRLEFEACEVNFLFTSEAESLASQASSLSTMHILRVRETMSMTDSFLTALLVPSLMPRLVTLDLSWCSAATDWSMTTICEGCPQLQSLHLLGNKITDDTLLVLASSCPLLMELVVGTPDCPYQAVGSRHVSDEGLIRLADGCPKLEYVHVHGCRSLTDRSIFHLMRSHRLMALDVGMTAITDSLFYALLHDPTSMACLHTLCELNLTACSNLNLTIDFGATRTLLGPVERVLQQCGSLRQLNCSRLLHLTTAYLYGFRCDPGTASLGKLMNWQTRSDYYADICVLKQKEIERVRRHMTLLPCPIRPNFREARTTDM